MKFTNSSNRPAGAARSARLRLLLVVPLCLVALACGLLAGVSSRASVSAAAAAQEYWQKEKGGSIETSGKGEVARGRVAKPGGKTKSAVTKLRGAVPLTHVPNPIGCATNPVDIAFPGGTASGTLASGDCRNPADNSFYDAYTFTGSAGQFIIIEMDSEDFDTYLYLVRPGETTLSYRTIDNDDRVEPNGITVTNSRLIGVLPDSGTYTILANSFESNEIGSYQLSVRGGCSATSINANSTANGTLAAGDCLLHDNTLVDVYSYRADTVGQQIAVTMSSTVIDPFLFLLSHDGFSELARNDDAGSRDARIPSPALRTSDSSSGFATLPASGTYYIIANLWPSNDRARSGDYSLRLDRAASTCPTQPITAGQTAAGQLATTDCRLPLDATFMDVYTFEGTAGQEIAITMTSTDFNAFLELRDPAGFLVYADNDGAFDGTTNARIPNLDPDEDGRQFLPLPVTGTYRIYANVDANNATPNRTGAYRLTVSTPNTNPACAVSLSPAVSPFIQGGGAGRFTVVPGAADPQCAWTATTTANWITINTGTTGSGTNRVTYTVAANNTGATRTGTITVNGQTHTVTQTGPTPPTVAFKFANYSVGEADASRSITVAVSRLGDTAGASTVEYRTVAETQQQAQIPCNPARTAARGTAFGRCDFATTVDTLTFLPGEAEKTFTIPLVNDVHVEGAETFQIELADPRGATLGAQTTATVTINDDDTVQPTTNPVRPPLPYGPDTPRFFVRMHYLDFLSREPEAGEPWTNVLVNCANPENPAHETNTPSAGCDRILVSKSFFESPEFRLKGFFVFLYHKASFGSADNPNYYPEYRDIVTDMRRVTGRTSAETLAKRLDFSEDWVTRPAFTARYNGLTNAQFVDTLLANVNATGALTQAGSGFTRDSLVADLEANRKTRAEVLRLIVESPEVISRQFNHAYVAMQYYGYLRRTPDLSGYLAWLSVINPPRSESPRVMVDGFLNSIEYLWRFGPN